MYLFKDSSISIHLVTNRGGLQLGEVASDGTEWKKRLTDFGAGVQAENYNEFLFDYISPDYKTFEPKPLWKPRTTKQAEYLALFRCLILSLYLLSAAPVSWSACSSL